MSDEIKVLVEGIKSDFHKFKEANDERLEKVEADRGVAELEAKLAKIEGAMETEEAKVERLAREAKTTEQLAEMGAALGRIGRGGAGGEKEDSPDLIEYKAAMIEALGKDNAPAPPWKDVPEFKQYQREADASGGFLVWPELETLIRKNELDQSNMRTLCNVKTLTGTNRFTFSSRLTNQTGGAYVAEAHAGDNRPATTEAVYEQNTIEAFELYTNPPATQQWLDDSYADAESEIAMNTAEEFVSIEEPKFTSGTGTGQPKGFIAYVNATPTAFTDIELLTSATTGGAWYNGDDLITLQESLKTNYQGAAVWMMNRVTRGHVRKLKDDQGQYLWVPGLQNGVAGSLLGASVYDNPNMLDGTAAAKAAIAYGDFRSCYTIVDRLGIRTLRDPYTVKGQVLFYSTKRSGGGVQKGEAVKVMLSGSA